jgi:signal transduction histidine kinase
MDVALREAKALERGIAFARWGGVALVLVLGPLFPNLSLAAVVALGAAIAIYNPIVMRASARAATLDEHRRVERIAFAIDLTIVAAGMLLFSPDPYWTTFLIAPIVIMAGAFRFGADGAIAATVVLSAAYVAISVFRSTAFGFGFEWQRTLFHISVFVLTAFMVERILRDARKVRLERERLIGELRRRVDEDDALVEVGRVVARLRDPGEVVPAVLEASRKVFRFERATVFTIDEERGEYRAIYRLSSDDAGGPPSFKIGEGLIAAALAEDRPLLVRDVLSDPRYVPRHLRERRRSVILVPLRVAGRPVAVLSLSRGLPDAFETEDLRQAEIVAAYVAQVLENARLFEEASTAEALRAADRMKDEFLATVSHELRTPLTIVRGALELLQRGVPSRTEQLFDQASRNLERLSRSVQDLIDLAQLREARVELEREFLSARELLDDTARTHQLLASQRGQVLVVKTASDLPFAYADRARMLQVLGNVVANAIRYGPLDSPIMLGCDVIDGELRFRIVDQGPGVPPEEREAIFNSFFRGRAKASGRVEGTGLGLAIAREYAEAHGGRIEVLQRSSGAHFRVTLPRKARDRLAAAA